jgi:hypothetical protein
MPVRWNIDPSRRLVEVVAEGDSDVSEFVSLMDAIEAANAVSYKKLIDVRLLTGRLHGGNIGSMAERIARQKNAGPFAVLVASGGPQDGLARLFVLIAEAQSRARVFRVEEEAREWLFEQAPEA